MNLGLFVCGFLAIAGAACLFMGVRLLFEDVIHGRGGPAGLFGGSARLSDAGPATFFFVLAAGLIAAALMMVAGPLRAPGVTIFPIHNHYLVSPPGRS